MNKKKYGWSRMFLFFTHMTRSAWEEARGSSTVPYQKIALDRKPPLSLCIHLLLERESTMCFCRSTLTHFLNIHTFLVCLCPNFYLWRKNKRKPQHTSPKAFSSPSIPRPPKFLMFCFLQRAHYKSSRFF